MNCIRKAYFLPVLCFLSIVSPYCFALDMTVQNSLSLGNNLSETMYSSTTSSITAHVIKIPLDTMTIELVPAIGQREVVSSIAKRKNAFIAINGSNYRRGGNYNGNRVNFLYFNHQIYTDLQLMRGSFGWNTATRNAVIDNVFLKVHFAINGINFPITAINQPRVAGQAVLYTDVADSALFAYTPGSIITINQNMIVTDISSELPTHIPQGWLMYQIDACPENIQVGMQVSFDFNIQSASTERIYNDHDFIVGGAGLLIQDGLLITEKLYQEFSQGAEIVHCADEIAADFHTHQMQEWLIELRHPRTAIGLTDQHEMCIVVVDGRQKHSEGMSLKELAIFMRQLGCVQALNIGGGGCTTLYINDRVVNSPSDGQARPVSEALCFFIR